uniref:CCHC-type domain-containing protein n=1 Tax=Mycena chlorophos TaxID=658473 RepID=A0ABQ0L236_MYCCL|nr:predicted protein [Mycena chlorophos]
MYPEAATHEFGTLAELGQLCDAERGIRVSEEGRLRRFGLRFTLLVRKLQLAPAVVSNREACHRYLETLAPTFASSLARAAQTRLLLAEDLAAASGTATATNAALMRRRDDPMLLADLMGLAERMASRAEVDTARLGSTDADSRLAGLEREIESLKTTLARTQYNERAAHHEVLDTLARLSAEDDPANVFELGSGGVLVYDPAQSQTPGPPSQATSRRSVLFAADACHYCRLSGHLLRDCPTKKTHLDESMVTDVDRHLRLANGDYIPKGAGSAAERVERYWSTRAGVMNPYLADERPGTQDTDPPPDVSEGPRLGSPVVDEFDVLRDDVRTLRAQMTRFEEDHEHAERLDPDPRWDSWVPPADVSAPVDEFDELRDEIRTLRVGISRLERHRRLENLSDSVDGSFPKSLVDVESFREKLFDIPDSSGETPSQFIAAMGQSR